MDTKESNKQKFIQLLQATKREGVDQFIKYLDDNGFFEAPASTKFHGCYEGGLCEHSLNVYQQAMYLYKVECKIKPEVEKLTSVENITIASLLHDVCKTDLYEKVKKWRKDETKPVGKQWEQYETYDHDYSKFPAGHGSKSVIVILKNGFKLTDQEILAIEWHMGAWDISQYNDDKKSYNMAGDLYPLVSIIHAADILASRITENDFKKKE